jgi:hypothetical protein
LELDHQAEYGEPLADVIKKTPSAAYNKDELMALPQSEYDIGVKLFLAYAIDTFPNFIKHTEVVLASSGAGVIGLLWQRDGSMQAGVMMGNSNSKLINPTAA